MSEALPPAGAVRADLEQILLRFDSADRRLHAAQVAGDRGEVEAAEAQRREALGDRYAAGLALADLWLLLTRHALEYRHHAAAALLADVLGDMLDQRLERTHAAIARLERKR